jgi:branched-chain amino acid transport system substrate-binding protein
LIPAISESPIRAMNANTHRVLYVLLAGLAALAAVSCSSTGRRAVTLDEQSRSYATRLLEQAQADEAGGNLEAAGLAIQELLNDYPGFARIDEATYLAGQIALERGSYGEAATYFNAVTDNYPLSRFRADAALSSARCYVALGMYAKGAEVLVRLLESPLEDQQRTTAETQLQELVRRRLSSSELESLAKKYPDSPVNRDIAVSLARFEYANANYDAAYDLLAEYLYRFPDDLESSEARRLLELAAEKKQPPVSPASDTAGPAGIVHPNTVGAVLPVTGPGQMSLFARYFEEGCRKAIDEFNASGGRQVNLASADSKGSAVGAVKAVRKLTLEDGAVGLVGAVFTMPTITASIEANAWRVPLLSPVVSSDDLLEIGPWIFETKVPMEVEVVAIADAAVTRLLLERIAVVSPDEGKYRDAADLFADEVKRLGAEVVEQTRYEAGATDFREQLESVREAAPDAIFISGDYKELLNLLPQVKFYDLQVQLLGLSNWNNENLLRLFKGELEGALFPLETYRGKDPETYRRLKAALEEDKGEVNPVTVAGYFGMHLLLEALASGASSREEVRAYLDTQLNQGADKRMEEARALTIMKVRSGKAVEFELPPRPNPQR